jgi:WD40 repeat protein
LLTLPERFVVTSAGKVNGAHVLGSRSGGLAIYVPEKIDGPISTWTPPDAYPGDAITSIINVPNSINASHYFLTTCRDGTYSIFRATDTNQEIALVHQGTPPFGPMIEAAWFSGSELVLYGFKSKNFIVWNESKQYEISSVECGGAHRSYASAKR